MERMDDELDQLLEASASAQLTILESPTKSPVPCKKATNVPMVKCSDVIVRCLSYLKVDFVFGIPGGNIEPFYNAMGRFEEAYDTAIDKLLASPGRVEHVLARHESGAVFMAHGYARASGRLGVVCTTTGPGITNTITGVSAAYMNYVPMLIITAQTCLDHLGSNAFQESSCGAGINAIQLFSSCTRYNTLVSSKHQLKAKLQKAISHAFGPNPGPVHLSIPKDILEQSIPWDGHALKGLPVGRPKVLVNTSAKESLLSLIMPNNLANGIIWVGAYASECSDLVLRLAELLQWQIAVTPMGKGVMPANHPLFIGVYGISGHEYVTKIMASADCEYILSIGAEMDEMSMAGWRDQAWLTQKLIQIADIPELLELPVDASLKILGSIREVLDWLVHAVLKIQRQQKVFNQSRTERNLSHIQRIDGLPHSASLAEDLGKLLISGQKQLEGLIHPRYLIAFLNQILPKSTKVVLDTGNSVFWGVNLWRFRHHPRQVAFLNQFFIELHFAAMGWAIGAAVGVALAEKKDPILCMTGDGAYLMSGQEITVAVELQLNIIYVVLNDGYLGTVKHGQIMSQAKDIANQLPTVNFAQMASAVGAHAYSVTTFEDLRQIDFQELLSRKGPTLLDVHIDHTAVPPIGSRVKSLNQTQ